jgi:hypothetical protein
MGGKSAWQTNIQHDCTAGGDYRKCVGFLGKLSMVRRWFSSVLAEWGSKWNNVSTVSHG